MAIKFQYNKVSLQEMQKQLKARADALPVLTYKEAILRSEAEKAKKRMTVLEEQIQQKLKQYEYLNMLWQEFPQDAVSVSEIKTSLKNIPMRGGNLSGKSTMPLQLPTLGLRRHRPPARPGSALY